MFEWFKAKYWAWSALPGVGESPFKSQQPKPLKITPIPTPKENVIAEPTAMGQSTTTPRFSSLLKSLEPKIQWTISEPTTAVKQPNILQQIFGWRSTKEIVQWWQPIIKPEVLSNIKQKVIDFNVSSRAEYNQSLQDQPGIWSIKPLANTVLSDALLGVAEWINQISNASRTKPDIQDIASVWLWSLKTFWSIFFPAITAWFSTLWESPVTKDVVNFLFEKGNKQIVWWMDDFGILKWLDEKTKEEALMFIRWGILFWAVNKIMKPASSNAIVPYAEWLVTEPGKIQSAIQTLNPKPGETLKQAYVRNINLVHPDKPGWSTAKAQAVNEAFKTITDANMKEALGMAKSNKSFMDNIRDIVGNVKQSFQEFIQSPSMWSKVVDVAKYKDTQWNLVPAPKNISEYKALAEGMLAGTVMSDDKMAEINAKSVAPETTKTEFQTNAENEAKTILEISTRLDIVPEALPQYPIAQDKVIKAKIAKTKSPFKKAQILRDYEELRKTQRALEQLEWLPEWADAQDILDTVINDNVNTLNEKNRNKFQIEQIDAFLTDHVDFKDTKAQTKLEKVLAGQRVKDNGVDYNAEVERIMQRNLDMNQPKQEKDITEIMREMDQKKAEEQVQASLIPEVKPTETKPIEPVFNKITKLPEKEELLKTIPDRPLYHGTLEQFDSFDITKAWENTEYDNAKRGIFFSDSPQNSKDFLEVANPWDKRPQRIIEAKVNIKKPLDLTLQGMLNKPEVARLVLEILWYDEPITSDQEALDVLDDNTDLWSIEELFEWIYSDINNKKIIQDAWYDGIVAQMGKDDKWNIMYEYVAFNPEQIKIIKPNESPVKPTVSKKETVKIEQPTLNKKQLDSAIGELTDLYKGFLKEWQEIGAKFAMGKILGKKKMIEEARLKQPTIADITKLFNKYTPEVLREALKVARDKKAINSEDYAKIGLQLEKALSNPEYKLVNDTVRWQSLWLSDKQKVAMLHRNKFNDIFKDTKDHKVNFTAVSEALRKDNLRLHVVSPGSFQRLPIPFSLMGNKSSTAQNILAPLVLQWLSQWAEVYVEPFGGAWTSILLLPQYFKQTPSLKVHINVFDPEKYTLIDRVRGKDEKTIYSLVSKNYKVVMGDITKTLMENAKFKETVEDMIRSYNTIIEMFGGPEWAKTIDIGDIDKLIGTKQMWEIAELVGFFPNLAKQYFKERIDGKVSIKWELTESFKEWLEDKIRKDWEKRGLEWELLETYIIEQTKNILSEESKVFEKQYPGMTKAISTSLDKYDQVKDNMTPDEAMLTSIARQLRQRGTSGQRVVSAGEWFQNVEWVHTKLRYGLSKYAEVLNKYWERIDIQNKDWGKFISDMATQYAGKIDKIIRYDDPPYTQSAEKTYKQNTKNPELAWILKQFADPRELAKMYEPLRDAKAIMTNDINWPYMTAMKKLYWDRLNPDILGYREWTTPTSLMTTTDFNSLPGRLNLWYYTIRRNPKFTTMEEALKSEVLPKIAKWLEKPLVKMFQNFSLLDEKLAIEMVHKKEQMEKGTIKKEEAERLIQSIMSDKQKRSLINKFYNNLKRSSITWSDAVRLFKIIERYMRERDDIIEAFKNTKKLIEKKNEIDIKAKELLKAQLDQYTTSNPTGEAQILSAKYDAGDTETIYEYHTNPKVQEMIDSVNKVNINSLDNAQIQQITEQFKMDLDQGIDKYKYYKKQEQQYVDEQIKSLKPGIKKEDFAKTTVPDIFEAPSVRQHLWAKRKDRNKLAQKVLDDVYTPVRGFEELGMIEPKEQLVDQHLTKRRDKKVQLQQKYIQKRSMIENKYKEQFSKHDMEMIGINLLLNKDRGLGIGAFIEYVNYKTPWLSKEQIMAKIEQWKSGELLSEQQKELIPIIREIFNEMGEIIAPVYELDQNKLFVKLENYYPVVWNKKLVEKTPRWVKDDTSMLETLDTYWASINQWFTKQAKGGKIIPIINAEIALFKHINDGLYYANMQEPLKRLTQITNWLESELWTRWYRFIAEYIDRLKKQGNINQELDTVDRLVEKTLVSLRKGILMAKIPLAIMQMTDLFKAYWVSWHNPVPALFEILGDKKVREEIRKMSWHIRHREVDDPVYAEESWITGKLGKYWDLIEKYGMMPIAYTDRLATSAIFRETYKAELRKSNKTPWDATPEEKKQASLKADTMAMKIASDPSFAGVAKAVLTNRGLKKFFTLFQNYSITQASQVRGTAINKWMKSHNMARLLIMMAIAITLEQMIRDGYKKMKGKEWAFQMKLLPDKYKTAPITLVTQQIPIAGNIIDVFYWDTPLAQYLLPLVQKYSYKDMDAFTRKVIFSIGRLAGMPVNPIQDIYDLLNSRSSYSSSTSNGKF